jgi:hypothetical protein
MGATSLGLAQVHRRSPHLRRDPNTFKRSREYASPWATREKPPRGPNSEFADKRNKECVRMLNSNWTLSLLRSVLFDRNVST